MTEPLATRFASDDGPGRLAGRLAGGAPTPSALSKFLDLVARVDLRNGARLDRIDWLGDRSTESLRQSAGFLVNCVYDLKSIERNHEADVKTNAVVTSVAVARLAQRKGAEA